MYIYMYIYIYIYRAIFMFQCAQGQQINCAPKFLDQYMYKFSFEKPKKKKEKQFIAVNIRLL